VRVQNVNKHVTTTTSAHRACLPYKLHRLMAHYTHRRSDPHPHSVTHPTQTQHLLRFKVNPVENEGVISHQRKQCRCDRGVTKWVCCSQTQSGAKQRWHKHSTTERSVPICHPTRGRTPNNESKYSCPSVTWTQASTVRAGLTTGATRGYLVNHLLGRRIRFIILHPTATYKFYLTVAH
jgi:hypothetical protein